MVGFRCRAVPVEAFNRLAEPHGISVFSRDGVVDRGDRFERRGANGPHGLSFRSDEVQSIIRLWRADCAAIMRRASSPQMRELARAFRVRFGPPLEPSEGGAERLGVYRGRAHLFDIDASEGKGEEDSPARFTEKQAAHLLAAGLDRDLPARYRARVLLSGSDRRRLETMGVRIDAARESIKGPSGEIFRYGGSASEGYTRVVSIAVRSAASIRIIMHKGDGNHRIALFRLNGA